MEILYFLIPLAMVILAGIVFVFFWAVRSGQMDDLEGPAYRILMDDDAVEKRNSEPAQAENTSAADADKPPQQPPK